MSNTYKLHGTTETPYVMTYMRLSGVRAKRQHYPGLTSYVVLFTLEIRNTTMISQLRRIATAPITTSTLRRHLSTPAAAPGAASGLMKLNFNLPQETLYDATNVKSVIVPGAMGEYEVTADHVPIVAELKAGMLTIKHEDGEDEKYFVPGGFSLTHEGSTTVS